MREKRKKSVFIKTLKKNIEIDSGLIKLVRICVIPKARKAIKKKPHTL
jgi:hypothetical protein